MVYQKIKNLWTKRESVCVCIWRGKVDKVLMKWYNSRRNQLTSEFVEKRRGGERKK